MKKISKLLILFCTISCVSIFAATLQLPAPAMTQQPVPSSSANKNKWPNSVSSLPRPNLTRGLRTPTRPTLTQGFRTPTRPRLTRGLRTSTRPRLTQGPRTPFHYNQIVEHPTPLPRSVKSFTPIVKSVISTYPESYDPDLAQIWPFIPHPKESIHVPGKLTLQDAILLALRYNPNIVNSELTRITDKYSLIESHWAFEPQYSLSTTTVYSSEGLPQRTLNAGVSLATMVGTSVSFDYTNSFQTNRDRGTGTFTLTQPLLRGFGYVARIPWLDALDNELIARLNFQNEVIAAVIEVISAYRTLVGDYNNLKIQGQNLKETRLTVKQFELQVKVGKMAKSDLRQQQANLENAKFSLVQQQDQLQNDYQNFLSAIGLIPSAKINIVKEIHYEDVHLPPLDRAIELALENNQGYQQSLIELRQTKRAIASARDARKPLLNLVYSQPTNFGASVFTAPNGNTSGMVGPESLTINFSLPIDDVAAKSQLVSAEVAFEKAKISLEQQKEDLVRQVITQYRSLQIQRHSIEISERAVALQKRTLEDARIKFKYGKATMFEVIQDQDQLLSSATNLVSQKIQYLNAVATFYQTLGIILQRWNIQLRY